VRSSALWIGTLRHHFHADFTAMWGAGRLRREGRDPYFDAVFVDGVYFPRSQFPYGPLVSALFQPLGRLDFATARAVWLGLQIGALVALLFLGLESLPRALLAAAVLVVVSPVIVFPLFAHLERGQIDLFVAAGAFASLVLWERGFGMAAGAMLLGAAVLKLPTVTLLLVPLAAGDAPVILGAALAALLAAGAAWLIDGPERIARYCRVVLPAFDRTGRLPPELYAHPTPAIPVQRWNGRDFHNAVFAACDASLTRYVRQRWGYAAGTVLGAAGLLATFLAAGWAFAAAPTGDVRTLAWLAMVTAMLLFQPLTWLMGCVHLIVVGLRLDAIRDLGGSPAGTLAVCGLALVALGDVFVPFLPRRIADKRPILGLLVLWLVLTVTLVTVR